MPNKELKKLEPAVMISRGEILHLVDKICLSAELSTKLQLCRLLKYLVVETLDGRENKLKGFTIGVEVYNKKNDFNPELDPIVRIHAGRLRRMLNMYYMGPGKTDPVRIEIPKGQYIPIFLPNNTTTIQQLSNITKQKGPSTEPTVVVFPFKNLNGNADHDYFALGLAEELSVELTRFDDLIVLDSILFADNQVSAAERQEFILKNKIRFILEGGVHQYGNQIKILVKLIDTLSEEQIWAERFNAELDSTNLIEIQENIAQEISCILGSEYGIILNQLSKDRLRIKPLSFDTYNAVLKFHYFEANQTAESASAAFFALQEALKKDPKSGIAAAMLASIYGNRYMLDIPLPDDAAEQFRILADKAIRIEPNNLTVNIVHTFKQFAFNNREAFFREAEHCLSLKPNSPLRLGTLGHYLALYGDWERGKEILDRVMNMSVKMPLYLHGARCLYYYRLRDYNNALNEALQYAMPALFWGPLLRAAVFGQLEEIEEAKSNVSHLLSLKPDFETKAHYLISRFVKEDELVEHILEGLRKAEMKV